MSDSLPILLEVSKQLCGAEVLTGVEPQQFSLTAILICLKWVNTDVNKSELKMGARPEKAFLQLISTEVSTSRFPLCAKEQGC